MIQSLNELTRQELRSLKNFINSPYFNRSERLIKLFVYLERLYPNIKAADIEKTKLAKAVYPREKYDDTKARKLMSDLVILLEKFYLYNEFEGKASLKESILLEALGKRDIKKRFEVNYKKIVSSEESKYIKDGDHYDNMYSIYQTVYWYEYPSIKHEFPEALQKASDNADYMFFFRKLHIFRDMYIHQTNTRKTLNFEKNFREEILRAISNKKDIIKAQHPNLYIIYLAHLMETTKDINYLDALINFLRSNSKKFDKERSSYYYNYIVSFYWAMINAGNSEYLEKVFNIYKYMIASGIFRTDKYIDEAAFNNVVLAAIWADQLDWLEKFIEGNKKFLDPIHSSGTYHMALSHLHFSRKEYSKVLDAIHNVELKDPKYFLSSKYLLFKTYYELGEMRSISYVLDSLRHYAHRKDILIADQAKNAKRAVKYFTFLTSLRNGSNSNTLKIKMLLENEKELVPQKKWIIEKLDELEDHSGLSKN